jgi:hypothetical protein
MKIVLCALIPWFCFSAVAEVTDIEVISEPSVGLQSYKEQISQMAAASSCGQYRWRSRGAAPSGYIKGMALSYGRSFCKLKTQNTPTPTLGSVAIMRFAVGTRPKDALSYYRANLKNARIDLRSADDAAVLRTLYTLGIGLGMRESSGKYCEGYDTSVRRQTSDTAEAGLFQTSYNSMASHPVLNSVYQEYKAHPERCLTDVYQENVSCADRRNSQVVGRGPGAEFQQLTKSCPAFATEYAMVMLRVQRNHYGPILRRQAEVNPACYAMFNQIESLIATHQEEACAELK